jgi:hypothetical protein
MKLVTVTGVVKELLPSLSEQNIFYPEDGSSCKY